MCLMPLKSPTCERHITAVGIFLWFEGFAFVFLSQQLLVGWFRCLFYFVFLA